jgi:adenosylhomocysteine nucleosidase
MAEQATDARSPGQGLTAVLAALPEEAASLRRRLHGVRRVSGVPLDAVVGRLGQLPLALAITGDGEHHARAGLAAVLGALPVRRLLVIGVSGGLSPELVTGALVVAERVLHERGGVVVADRALALAATATSAGRLGSLVSALNIADTPLEKRRLLRLSGVGAGPAAVDLESAAYAEIAERAGLPWLFLRAISDTADEALPPLLNACRDVRGSVRRRSVIGRLLANPRPLPALLGLRRRVSHCAEVLGRAAEAVLTELPRP